MSRTLSITLGVVLIIIIGFFALRYFVNVITPQAGTTAATTSQGATTTIDTAIAPPSATTQSTTTTTTRPTPTVTYKNATSDQIRVIQPTAGDVTGKSFRVTGQVRGNWYFEASFPVKVLDANGKVLVSGTAKAQGDWMTTNFVQFSVDLTVPQSYIGKATIVLSKDNPSGMPQNDASLSVPITIEY